MYFFVNFTAFELLVLICLFPPTKSSSFIPATVEKADEPLPDCNGICPGQLGAWTAWGDCSGGKCHLKEGRQRRQTFCYVMVTPAPSRSDGGSRQETIPDNINPWKERCRQTQESSCIEKKSCAGEWSDWEQWAACTMTSVKNTTCLRTRRRTCMDHESKRLAGSHCYGGLLNDTQNEMCRNESCFRIEPRMSPEGKRVIIPLKTATKEKPNSVNHNTILVIAVAVGSLVFGAVFVLLLLNLVRRSVARGDSNNSSRRERWKRIGSTNTSSIGYSTSYAAASDILSPRMDTTEVRSPSSATTGSGSSGISQLFFGHKDAKSPPTLNSTVVESSMLTVSGAVNANGRPRRSRLLQENVYWEITDTTSLSFDEDSEEIPTTDIISASNNRDREEVHNVLYGSRV